MLSAAAAGLLLATGLWSLGPAWIHAPAIVEYAPLTVIRAASPGFVEGVLVASGDTVRQGQPLVILRNDELQIELTELDLAIEQSRVRARMHQQAEELAKYQAELANGAGLAKQRAEVQRQVASLTILAPRDGRVIGRPLDWLAGQYLESGDEIAVLGDESSKELLVAVGQDDFELFHSQLEKLVRVVVHDSRRVRFDAALARLEPRATQDPPHDALLATAGGPLTATGRTDDSGSAPSYQLLTPCFTGRIALNTLQSQQLACGQLLTISFHSNSQTLAAHYLQSLEAWLRSKLAGHISGRNPQ
jgi:putative peptide zinc metalloprotease protein